MLTQEEEGGFSLTSSTFQAPALSDLVVLKNMLIEIILQVARV